MKEVYEFKRYKDCLSHFLVSKGQKWGSKTQLAQAIKCQPGFVSQVLNGDLHFSQDQMLGVCSFLQFDESETDFLILLLNKDRAGNLKSKSYFDQKIKAAILNRESIKNRIKNRRETKAELASEYYSSWKYNVLHMLLRNEKHKNQDRLKQLLNLTSDEFDQMISLLKKMELIDAHDSNLEVTNERVHIPSDSKWVTQHHVNWRIETIKEIQERPKKGLHFSSVMSISASAHEKIQSLDLVHQRQ